MWGENWGELIWGGVTAVPLLGPLGLGLMAAGLAVLGANALRSTRRHAGVRRGVQRFGTLAIVAVGLGVALAAHAVTLPFSFTNGTVADADEVNGNFQALSDAVDAGPTIYVDANFQLLSLADSPGITAATLTLPVGDYLLQAKLRYQNNGTVNENPSCSFLDSSGTGVGSLDASAQRVAPGALVDGFLMTDVRIFPGQDPVVNLQCFGSSNVSVLNSQFVAIPSVFSFQ